MSAVELSIPVPWGKVAAKAWGNSDKLEVLAIHGFQDNAASFDQLAPRLADQFYFVCIDLPGHGHSSHFPSGLSFSLLDCVFAIKNVVDHLKWHQFSILAHSFGGHVAIYYTALFGDSIHRLILIDVFLAILIPDGDFVIERCLFIFDKLFSTVDKTDVSYTYGECLKKLSEERTLKLDTKSAKALQARSFKETQNGFIQNNDVRLKLLSYPLMTLDFHKRLIEKVNCNTLLISTSAFEPFLSVPMTKNTLDKLKANLNRKMNIVKLQGSHDIHMDDPITVAPIIKEFILKLESSL